MKTKFNSFVTTKVKHLRTKYKVLDIEVDGGVGIPTIDAAAQVPSYDTDIIKCQTVISNSESDWVEAI